MAPILYKMDMSPPARAVIMLADIIGLDLELRDLNYLENAHKTPEFTMKNPMRTVPILDEGDYCLADSHAINLYLLKKYGRPEHEYLYPSDERLRATVNQRLFFDCGILFSRLSLVLGQTFGGKLKELSKHMMRNFDDAYRTLEEYLSRTTYVAHDSMTVADINCVATVSAIESIYPIDEKRYPKLKHWFTVMSEKDFYKRKNAAGATLFGILLKRLMETNRLNEISKL